MELVLESKTAICFLRHVGLGELYADLVSGAFTCKRSLGVAASDDMDICTYVTQGRVAKRRVWEEMPLLILDLTRMRFR